MALLACAPVLVLRRNPNLERWDRLLLQPWLAVRWRICTMAVVSIAKEVLLAKDWLGLVTAFGHRWQFLALIIIIIIITTVDKTLTPSIPSTPTIHPDILVHVHRKHREMPMCHISCGKFLLKETCIGLSYIFVLIYFLVR